MSQATPRDGSQASALPTLLARLRASNEALATQFGAALTELLHIPARVALGGVDSIRYGRFVESLEAPACFFLIAAGPIDDRWMLDIEPAILHAMIDRLLGGDEDDQPPPNRPLTEVELRLAERLVRLFLDACQTAWKDSLELTLSILRAESNPKALRILPADETTALVAFELTVGRRSGPMRLCLPCRTLDCLGEQFHAASQDADAVVAVVLAETSIAAADLAGLRPGDIIATETPADAPAVVSIDGVDQFHAKPGVYQGRKAVRLIDPIARQNDGGNP